MTEKEILDWQEQTGNQEFFLMQVGKFLHAYGNGAFALSRVHRRDGSLCALFVHPLCAPDVKI